MHDVSAQAPATAAVTSSLTVDDAIAMAKSNSPLVQDASAAARQAKAGITTARAYSNPSLEVYEGQQYARAVSTPGIPGHLQHYAAYQPIEIPSERATRRRAAEHLFEAAQFGQQSVLLSVIGNTRRAFYDSLLRQKEVQLAEENLRLVEDLLRRVKVEVDVGEKGQLELTRATSEVARSQFAVRSAELEYAQSIARLRSTIAAPADRSLVPAGDLDAHRDLPALPEAREAVLAHHPIVKEAAQQREAAVSTLANERALRIPRPTAFAEFENQPDLRYWRTGISIPLPLFDRRRGQTESAKAQIDRAEQLVRQRTLELTSALERAYEQYQLADQQANSLESGSLRAAERAVEAAQSAYRFGERGIVEVLDAQRVLQSVRNDLLNAQFARQAAVIDLEELGALSVPTGVKP